MGQDTRGTQGTKRIAVNAERSAGPIRTLFNKLDLLPSKLPRLFEQQWKLSTICGRLMDVLKLARVPLLLVATFATLPSISENPFLDCSFATTVVAAALRTVCHACRAVGSLKKFAVTF